MVRREKGKFIFHTVVYGYIDKSAKWIAKPIYPEAHPFHDGLGRVRVSGTNRGRAGITNAGPLGYMDTTGKMVISAKFKKAADFSEGLAAVSLDGKTWGYIDKSGKMVIKPQFYCAGAFSEGFAVVYVRKKGEVKCGFVDKSGKIVIPPTFDSADDFSDGLAVVGVYKGDKLLYGFIDKTGDLVIAPQYFSAGPFCSGIAVVGKAGKDKSDSAAYRYGYINHKDTPVTQFDFENANPLVEGMGRIKIKGKYGFIDSSGKIVIAPQYVGAADFCGGLAKVEIPKSDDWDDWEYAYIDKTGKVVWQEKDDGK